MQKTIIINLGDFFKSHGDVRRRIEKLAETSDIIVFQKHREVDADENITVAYSGDKDFFDLFSSTIDYIDEDSLIEMKSPLIGILGDHSNGKGFYNNPMGVKEWKDILNAYATRKKDTIFEHFGKIPFDKFATKYLSEQNKG